MSAGNTCIALPLLMNSFAPAARASSATAESPDIITIGMFEPRPRKLRIRSKPLIVPMPWLAIRMSVPRLLMCCKASSAFEKQAIELLGNAPVME